MNNTTRQMTLRLTTAQRTTFHAWINAYRTSAPGLTFTGHLDGDRHIMCVEWPASGPQVVDAMRAWVAYTTR